MRKILLLGAPIALAVATPPGAGAVSFDAATLARHGADDPAGDDRGGGPRDYAPASRGGLA